MTGWSMAGLAVITMIILFARGHVGRVGIALALLCGAALGGLDPVARVVYEGATAVGNVAVEVGSYADTEDWTSEGARG